MADLAHVVLGAGVTTAFHPIGYAKVLIQLGYEPIAPRLSTSLFGKQVLVYPNVFQYISHIKKVDGFVGLYRGLIPRICGGIVGTFVTNHVSDHFQLKQPKSRIRDITGEGTEEEEEEQEQTEEDEEERNLQSFCKQTAKEMLARCAGVTASQPLFVIMLRSMSQFVGREEKYSGFFSAIAEVYHNDGVLGYFAGLLPRLVGEIVTLWVANLLAYAVNTFLFTNEKEMKTYTSAACGESKFLQPPAILRALAVTHITYPFSLVSNIMAVTDSGLAAATCPGTRLYSSWWDCWTDLSSQGQLKRGSSLFWRYYKGPVIMKNGRKMAASYAFN